MVAATGRLSATPIHPAHALLLAFAGPLFLGGLLSDIAYARTYEIQWSNFAAWLIAGAMVFTGFALLWSLVAFITGRDNRRGGPLIGLLLLAAAFVLGLINAFVHAKDAWAVMPEALVLSIIVTILAFAVIWIGFSSLRPGVVR